MMLMENAHVMMLTSDAYGRCLRMMLMEDVHEVEDSKSVYMAFCDWLKIRLSPLWANYGWLGPSELGFSMIVYK